MDSGLGSDGADKSSKVSKLGHKDGYTARKKKTEEEWKSKVEEELYRQGVFARAEAMVKDCQNTRAETEALLKRHDEMKAQAQAQAQAQDQPPAFNFF